MNILKPMKRHNNEYSSNHPKMEIYLNWSEKICIMHKCIISSMFSRIENMPVYFVELLVQIK